MHQNVIELRPRNPNAEPPRLPYELEFRTSAGPQLMRTHDRAMIRRQMNHLVNRGVMAVCKRGGEPCGSVIAITQADDTIMFRASLEGESWGD